MKTASPHPAARTPGSAGSAARTLLCSLPLFVLWPAGAGAPAATNALPPAEELASFHLADPQLSIELVASEPDVISPVAIAWDADGRLFVAEMRDYPNAGGGGRIKLLEDRDGDGRYERVSVFADGLPFPNGVLPWNGGVLVTAAPDIWFLRDTNGDGRADERRALFTGFARGNQQLRVNGLLWGLDNWVYGANGRSDGEVRPAGRPDAPAVSLRGHDFRFRPDTGEFEAIAGRSQFGLARDDWGNRFLSWNTIPIRHEVLPERFLNRNPQLAATESIQDLLEPGDSGRVFPLTPAPLTFNDESTSHFNALAGLHVFRGDALGPSYAGNAFVGESLRNLAHRRVLEPSGPTFVARRVEQEREFLASTDPWFHPVNFATGPDGALYVVDFYRRFVEHPDFVHTKERDEIPWRTGSEHGRLWRIRRKDSPPDRPREPLSRTSALELVRCLERTNAWWRDTAQRLLVERRDHGTVADLARLVQRGARAETRVQALSVLQGLQSLEQGPLRAALGDKHPLVRAAAVRALTDDANARQGLEKTLLQLARDPDGRVRFQVALALGALRGDARNVALAALARKDATNRWHALALLSSLEGGAGASGFWQRLVEPDPHWLNAPTPAESRFLEQVSQLIGTSGQERELRSVLDQLGPLPSSGSLGGPLDRLGAGRLAVLAGMAEGLARSPRPLREFLVGTPGALGSPGSRLAQFTELAAKTATDARATPSDRLLAIRVAKHAPGVGTGVLTGLLRPEEPPAIQVAAARALADAGDPGLFRQALTQWSRCTRATRREVSLAATRSASALVELLQAVELGTIQPIELDAAVRQALLRAADLTVRQRAEKLFNNPSAADRAEVVRRYQPALELTGDARRGAALFARTCLQCHVLQNQGQAVGPDLAGLGSRPKEAVLVDLLDPSRQVSPDFVSYSLVTTKEETLTGLIAAETGSSVTLRRAGQPDETILRSQIKEWKAEGKSLMPDGLEQGLTESDLADLLQFLGKPDASLLPKAAPPAQTQ